MKVQRLKIASSGAKEYRGGKREPVLTCYCNYEAKSGSAIFHIIVEVKNITRMIKYILTERDPAIAF